MLTPVVIGRFARGFADARSVMAKKGCYKWPGARRSSDGGGNLNMRTVRAGATSNGAALFIWGSVDGDRKRWATVA